MQEQLARADSLKAEGNKAFADGDMETAIVSLILIQKILKLL